MSDRNRQGWGPPPGRLPRSGDRSRPPRDPAAVPAWSAGSASCSACRRLGNGPNYVEGPIRVRPPDPFDLDRDHDGEGCET
jgi:hypothetical protein